jgi:hypothetical protein
MHDEGKLTTVTMVASSCGQSMFDYLSAGIKGVSAFLIIMRLLA